MSNGYEYDEGLGLLEYDEYDESYDETEAAEARRRRRPQPARPRRYGAPAAAGNQPVTRSQLEAALRPIGADMRKNAAAIQTIGQQTLRDTSRLRRDFQSGQQMSALMPLLMRPTSITTAAPLSNIPAGTRVMTDTDGFAAMLPLMLMGGFGGQQPGQGQSDQSMLMLVLAMSMMRRP